MTKTTPHRGTHISVWILAAAFALGGIAEVGPAVLCIGDDGHADVEFSLAGCCVQAADARNQIAQMSADSGGPGCDDCVDLGLDQNILNAGKELLPVPEASLSRFGLSQSEPGSAKMSSEVQRSVHDTLTTVLSSTVLLI